MSFDQKAERFAMVDLDFQPDGSGFTDAGSFLMTTDWGEDLYAANDSTPGSTRIIPAALIGKLRAARRRGRRR